MPVIVGSHKLTNLAKLRGSLALGVNLRPLTLPPGYAYVNWGRVIWEFGRLCLVVKFVLNSESGNGSGYFQCNSQTNKRSCYLTDLVILKYNVVNHMLNYFYLLHHFMYQCIILLELHNTLYHMHVCIVLHDCRLIVNWIIIKRMIT